MNLNEYEAEYCDSIAYYSKQLAEVAAESAKFTGLLLQTNQFESPYHRQMAMKQLEHYSKEMSKISNEIASLYNKWLGYQSVNYRTNENA
jgi:hypothetical protein